MQYAYLNISKKQQNKPDPCTSSTTSIVPKQTTVPSLTTQQFLGCRETAQHLLEIFLSVRHKMSPQKQLISKVLCSKFATWILSEVAPHRVRRWVVCTVGRCCLSELLQLSRRLEGFLFVLVLFCFFHFLLLPGLWVEKDTAKPRQAAGPGRVVPRCLQKWW